jgi:hypothetical protein
MMSARPQQVVVVLCHFVPLCALNSRGEGRNSLIHMVGTAGFEPTTSTV